MNARFRLASCFTLALASAAALAAPQASAPAPAARASAAKAPAAAAAPAAAVGPSSGDALLRLLTPAHEQALAAAAKAPLLESEVKALTDDRRKLQRAADDLGKQISDHLKRADAAEGASRKAQPAGKHGPGPAPSAAPLETARQENEAAATKLTTLRGVLVQVRAIDQKLNAKATEATTLEAAAKAAEQQLGQARTRARELLSELGRGTRKAQQTAGEALQRTGYSRAGSLEQKNAEADKEDAKLAAELTMAQSQLAALEKVAKEAVRAPK